MTNKRRAPRPVGSILREAPRSLQALVRRAGDNQDLHDAVRALLPDPLVAEVRAVHAEDDMLVVVASSSAWATRLRFVAPRLLEQLRARDDLEVPPRLKVVVRTPTAERETPPPPRPVPPTRAAAEALVRCAESLPADDPLRRALERLARRAGTRRQS